MGCGGSKAPEPEPLGEGQVHASDVEVGAFVLLDDVVCEVTEAYTIETKQAGVTKRAIKGQDVFTELGKMVIVYSGVAITKKEVTITTYTLADEGQDDDDEGNYVLKAADGSLRKDLSSDACEAKAKMAIADAMMADKQPKLTVVKVGDKERIVKAEVDN